MLALLHTKLGRQKNKTNMNKFDERNRKTTQKRSKQLLFVR